MTVVNKTQLAQIVGRSEEWITQSQKDPSFPVLLRRKGRAGSEYETSDVIAWMQRKQVDNLLGDTAAIDIEEAKRRKLAAEAELAETELHQVRGRLIELEEVEKTWSELFAACRARLLSLPSKLSPEVFAADSVTEVKGILKAGVIEALNELSDLEITSTSESESDAAQSTGDAETTSEPDGIGLG